jgi:hypothetical protein
VYRANNNLKMSETAIIASNNDVTFNQNGWKITVAGPLSGAYPVATITPASYPGSAVTVLTDPWTVSGGVSGYEATPADIAKFAVTPQTGPVYWTVGRSGATKGQLVKEIVISATIPLSPGTYLSFSDPGTVKAGSLVVFATDPADDGTDLWHIRTTPKVDGTSGNTLTNGLGTAGGGTANTLIFTSAGTYRVDIVLDATSGTYSGWFNLTVGS